MSETINNGIPFVPENTIDPAAGLNLSLNVVDARLNASVLSVGDDSPPMSPQEGDSHIVGDAPTGGWSGKANHVARYLDGAWHFYAPTEGWFLYDSASSSMMVFDGSDWVVFDTSSAKWADLAAEDDPTKGIWLAGYRGGNAGQELDRIRGNMFAARLINFDGTDHYLLTEEEMSSAAFIVTNTAPDAYLEAPWLENRMSDFFVNNMTPHLLRVGITGQSGANAVAILPQQTTWMIPLVPLGLVHAGDAPNELGYSVAVDVGVDDDLELESYQTRCQEIHITDVGNLLTGPITVTLEGRVSRPRIHNETGQRITVDSDVFGGSVVIPAGRYLDVTHNGTDLERYIPDPKIINITSNTVAAANHAGATIRATTGALTYTLSGDDPFVVGDMITFRVAGATSLTLVQGTNCTLNSQAGKTLAAASAGARLFAQCADYNETTGAIVWDLWGDFD